METETAIIQLEELAQKHGLIPHYLRRIAYLSLAGFKQNQIHQQTGYSEDTIVKYRRRLREMPDQEKRELLTLIAELEGV